MYAGSGSMSPGIAPPKAPSTPTPTRLATATVIIDPSGYDSAANTCVRKSASVAGLVTPPSK